MTSNCLSIFRKDRTNVGDWWSPPHRYFPISSSKSIDLLKSQDIPNEKGVYIVGGGGLGNIGFVEHLARLTRPDRKYKLVAWGVGADSDVDRKGLVQKPENLDHLLDFFSGFDEVGTRIHIPNGYGSRPGYRWVPCASCMSPMFRELRDRKPVSKVGYYFHKRVPIATAHFPGFSVLRRLPFVRDRLSVVSNSGANLRRKLEHMARFEFIVTNSYHGVYWATLLGRRAICQPFKDGLYTFRHAPSYMMEDNDLLGAMERAIPYPDALQECREANIEFYTHLTQTYGAI